MKTSTCIVSHCLSCVCPASICLAPQHSSCCKLVVCGSLWKIHSLQFNACATVMSFFSSCNAISAASILFLYLALFKNHLSHVHEAGHLSWLHHPLPCLDTVFATWKHFLHLALCSAAPHPTMSRAAVGHLSWLHHPLPCFGTANIQRHQELCMRPPCGFCLSSIHPDS